MYEDYPWYFKNNAVLDAWNITRGDGVTVEVVDSCVDFSLPQLSGRSSETYECQIPPEQITEINNFHGSAMAGLIVSPHEALPRLDYQGDYLKVAGISPGSLIRNSQHYTNYSSVTKVVNDFTKNIPITSDGLPVLFDEDQRPEILLINLSGGQKSSSNYVRGEWKQLISGICRNDHNILLISSVGNDKAELNKETILDNGVLPSSVKSRICKNKDVDPIIRVGAIAKTGVGEVPSLYSTALRTGSNYGKDYVDILAPGHEIPILSEKAGFARIAGGTSESAAIVSATASLIVKCRPLAKAQEVREIILDSSDSHASLYYAVDEGHVLNIFSAVKKGCFKSHVDDEVAYVEADGSVGFH